jgi:hypothetical protein
MIFSTDTNILYYQLEILKLIYIFLTITGFSIIIYIISKKKYIFHIIGISLNLSLFLFLMMLQLIYNDILIFIIMILLFIELIIRMYKFLITIPTDSEKYFH